MRRNLQKHTNQNPLHRWLLGRFHARVAELTAEVLGPAPAGKLLDAGCGEGFVSDYLRRRGSEAAVVGLDADRPALGMARERGGDYVEGSAMTLPFASGAFPLVLCLEVLEHLPKPEAALAELARVSTAHVIVSVPNQPFFSLANFLRGKNLSTWGEDPEHLHHWTAGQFRKLVSSHLLVEEVAYPFPWVVALCKRP